MKREVIEEVASLYSDHKNLKVVGELMGIPWQTVYLWLKKEGIEVTGDKHRYGGEKDQIALIGERLFKEDCPEAEDQNEIKFQPKYDYILGQLNLDVKTSFLRQVKGRKEGKVYPRWSFNCRVQQEADFLICYCLSGTTEEYEVSHVLLLPNEMVEGMQTISVTARGSKWLDYEISREDLKEFFKGVLITLNRGC